MPCLAMAIRLNALGASGSPITSTTLTPARGDLAARLGEHQLACFRPAEIGDRRGAAHALVDRREPAFAVAVDLDHAHQPVGARGQLLHRVRAPAAPGFLGPREHAVADLERGEAVAAFALLALDHPQARRRGGVVGAPGVGNGEGFAVLDLGHLAAR